MGEPAPFDIFSPIVDAIQTAVGDVFGVIRVFFADTVGQVLVALYTPAYCIVDFIIAGIQAVFGLVEIVFGWLPAPIFLSILVFILLYAIAYLVRFMLMVIHG